LTGTFNDHLVQPSCNKQGHLQLSQVAQSLVQPDLEHFLGWGTHNFSGQLFQCLTTLIVTRHGPPIVIMTTGEVTWIKSVPQSQPKDSPPSQKMKLDALGKTSRPTWHEGAKGLDEFSSSSLYAFEILYHLNVE